MAVCPPRSDRALLRRDRDGGDDPLQRPVLSRGHSFWIVRSQGLIYGYYSLFNLGRYPDVIFRGLFKFVFSWIIPIIVVTNVPTRLLIRAADAPAPLILQLAPATLIATSATRLFWLAALRRYASASS